MAELKIYRSGAEFTEVNIGRDVVRQWQNMGENKIIARFSHPSALELLIGDYITHKGQQWRINTAVNETKLAKNNYEYEVVFESREYTWSNKQLMHLGQSDFTFFGTPLTLITLIVDCINEIDPGWIIGTVDNTAEAQFFTFSNQDCRQALTTACEAFELEYKFTGRTLDVKQTVGTTLTGVTLSYGKGNGLYSLSRQAVADSNVATRVYGYGGTQNIPADYRGGMKRLTFAERKIDNNIAIYGVIETSVIFDDIFPERTASITGTANPTTVTDSTLDFDLNSVIVQGQAKILFKSGALGGNEFEITSYDHATKTIKFNSNQEESGYIMPNATVKAAVGDNYTLIGITMPESYKTAAEARLKTETTNYANTLKHPSLAYGLNIDVLQARAKGLDVNLSIGDKVRVTDSDMDVDILLRVQAISYPIINPAEITATINDKVTYTRAEKIRKVIAKQQEAIREIVKGSAELQRINSIRREELEGLIFDPDGYFDAENIRPLSINTSHIAVGSRSQEYTLSVILKPNFNGDANRIDWTAGVLTHFTIADTIKSWNIALGSKTEMVPGTAYYIYARCNKTGTTGTIVFDTVQRQVNSDATYYYFLVGVLSSVIDGIRWPTLTYGTTEINGGFIRTGRIESNDGKAWLDLTTSQFRLGDETGGLDWNYTAANQLTIIGRIVATSGEIGGFDIVSGVLQANLQKVTDIGAVTNKIMTAKGLRANELLVIPSIEGTEAGSIWHGDGTGSDLPPTDLPIASATVLGGVKIGNGLTINPSTGVLSVDAVDLSNYWTKAQSDSRYELSFSKNTAFNKNFGTIAGTVAQGNDSRILNGQTAFSWGNYRDYGLGVIGASDRAYIGNLDNDSLATGMYSHATDATGNPSASQGSLWVGKDYSGRTSNIHISSETNPELRFRRYTSSVWSPWRKVWHDSNFNPANYTLLSDAVLLTGNQTISGIKRFGTATTFLPDSAISPTLANAIHIQGSAPSVNGGTYMQGRDYQNNQTFILRNYVLAATGEQLTLLLGGLNANGELRGKTLFIDSEASGAVSHITFNRTNSYITANNGTIHFQTKTGAVIGINDSLLSLNADQTIIARGKFTGPTIQVTAELIIPTTAGTSNNAIWQA